LEENLKYANRLLKSAQKRKTVSKCKIACKAIPTVTKSWKFKVPKEKS